MVCRKELQREEIIAVKCSSYRVGGRKSKLSYRHAELGAVKVKQLGTFRPAHCSLYLLCSQGWERKNSFLFLLFTATLWKTVWKCLEKLKTALLYNPAILLLGIYPTKMKTLIWKHIWIPVFTVGFPDGLVVRSLPANTRDGCSFNLWSRKIPWRWKWPPTPGFLPWEIPWTERSLAGSSTRGHKRVRHNLAAKQQQHVHCRIIYDSHYTEATQGSTEKGIDEEVVGIHWCCSG